jgi:hypothetical protein
MLITAERDGYIGMRAKPAQGLFAFIRGSNLRFKWFLGFLNRRQVVSCIRFDGGYE